MNDDDGCDDQKNNGHRAMRSLADGGHWGVVSKVKGDLNIEYITLLLFTERGIGSKYWCDEIFEFFIPSELELSEPSDAITASQSSSIFSGRMFHRVLVNFLIHFLSLHSTTQTHVHHTKTTAKLLLLYMYCFKYETEYYLKNKKTHQD
jgi:hypothetical protein